MKILSTAIKGMGANYVGAPSFREVNPYGFFDHYKSDAYASAYPNIRAIAHEFMRIRPYAIDSNGKPLQKNAIINAIYHPNQADSSVAFFEKLAVSVLVNPKTYVLVWRNENGEAKAGGPFGLRGNRIAGFTFLENPSISVVDGKTYYRIGSQSFSQDSVIVIPGGVDPKNLYGGYSPTVAAKKWATLDEYIADFQQGFFENNAIPAGHFIITAASETDFKDTVKRMKEKHEGAGNNNKVTYTPRPVDPSSGKPTEAKIEWIPFAQANKDIDFKSLFEQANHRLDLSYGVPAIVKGVDDAATYANAQVAEKTFSLRAVYPLALRIWTQFTHELNRITGGIGIAITFKYDIPTIADEEKVNAETKSVEASIIRLMTDEGYSLESIVDAFQLSNSYKLLKIGNEKAKIDNDKPDVDEGGEVQTAPDPQKIDGVTPLNLQNELSDEDQLEQVALNLMQSQVDEAIANLDATNVASDDLLDIFVDDAYDILQRLIIIAAISQHDEGLALLTSLGLSTANVTDFNLKDEQIDRYRAYLRQVGRSYSEDTTKAIREVLDRANIDGLTAAEIKKELNQLPELEGYRATRLARTETVRAGGNGSLFSMEQIENETEHTIYKVWSVNNADACQFCKAMDGTRVPVKNAFIPVGGSVVAEDGSVLVNNFVDAEIASLHPNDTCSLIYEVE